MPDVKELVKTALLIKCGISYKPISELLADTVFFFLNKNIFIRTKALILAKYLRTS